MSEGRLYVCGTPIGNLEDVSDRLRSVLGEVGIVYAEDTRRTGKLLSRIGVSVPVRSLFAGNEKERTAEMLERLAAGADVAYVTDAGMPALSDPGAWVVRAAREAGHPVTVVAGPSAVTSALTASGFAADRFVFEGFLPRGGVERRGRIASIADDERTTVVFVSPHRIGADLADLAAALGADRQVAIAREMTKLHEEVWVGPISGAAERFGENVKGEVTVVIEGRPPRAPDPDQAVAKARSMVEGGVSPSDASRRVADQTGVSRRLIYQALLDQE
jgi:16S rRNA (cytidine1402-2'-O)-methyltransferase